MKARWPGEFVDREAERARLRGEVEGMLEKIRRVENDKLVQEVKKRADMSGENILILNSRHWLNIDPEIKRKIMQMVVVATSEQVEYGSAIICKTGEIYEDMYSRLMNKLMLGSGEELIQEEARIQSRGYEAYKHKKQENMCPADYGAHKSNRRKW